MKTIPSGSIDMILADLPYGTTACKWDSVIPFEPLWEQYRRIAKSNAAIVLTASQPFTSALVMSRPSLFKHEWIWEKSLGSNFLLARKAPLKVHETAVVFCRGTPRYFPLMVPGTPYDASKRVSKKGSNTDVFNSVPNPRYRHERPSGERFPRSVIYFRKAAGARGDGGALHPTQKPVALMEYLIRTYTNEDETVLDNTMGSGTTGVACVNTGRAFIGIELDAGYFEIAWKRIAAAEEKKRHDEAQNELPLAA